MLKPVAFLLFVFGMVPLSSAAVSLTVSPVDGGTTLHLQTPSSGLERKSEMRVRVTSTHGKRYQIYQRMVDPLVNEKGQILNAQAVQVQTLPNSNTSGTLYLQNRDRVGMGEQLVYTSGRNGESDSFLIAYFFDPQQVNADGNYRGKLMVSVRGTEDPSGDQALIDVSLQARGAWKADLRGGLGARVVRVKDSDADGQAASTVRFQFSGNAGGEVRLYQELESLPHNEQGEELRAGVLLVKGDPADGLHIQGGEAVKPTRKLIYSSSVDAGDVVVQFALDPAGVSGLNAGTYQGKVKYIIEREGGAQEYLMDLQVTVQPVFILEVQPPEGGWGFSRVLPDGKPQAKEVIVKVRSNLRKPYQVMQNFEAPLTNEKGDVFNSRFFSFKVEVPGSEKGRTRFGDFSPVGKGESPVFISDSNGAPATFKLIYQLQGYPQMSAGLFEVPVRFSLNQN